MPDFIGFEQFFTSGFYNLQTRFKYPFSQVPKGLLKLCSEYDVELTNALFEEYVGNPNAFNILCDLKIGKCSVKSMIEAMVYGHIIGKQNTYESCKVNPDNLLYETITTVTNKKNSRNSYFMLLVNEFSYSPKLLIEYVDSVKIGRKFKKSIFRDIYDYANMASKLDDDYDKYPSELSKISIQTSDEYNKLSIQYSETDYHKRDVLDYECEIDGFKFIYPKSTEEIKEEGKNQHNCVATYINSVLNGYCHIMFMRPLDNINESYITLEIKDNTIVQAKRKYNKMLSEEERAVVRKWNEKYEGY